MNKLIDKMRGKYFNKFIANKQRLNTTFYAVTALIVLTGCNATNQSNNVLQENTHQFSIDSACFAQVEHLEKATNPNASQYLMLAETSASCVAGLTFAPSHPDIHKAMQLTALSFVNYVKAGDMQSAANMLTQFRQSFPKQDLLFADYTSFVDTATVLVSQNEITEHHLAMLNINENLRAEMQRKLNWTLN